VGISREWKDFSKWERKIIPVVKHQHGITFMHTQLKRLIVMAVLAVWSIEGRTPDVLCRGTW
jgi:hypothetical protein